MSIVATDSITSYFHEVVQEAIKARHVEATDGATPYLVALLSDYARPDPRAGEALDRPLTFLLERGAADAVARRALRQAARPRRRRPLLVRLLRRPLRGAGRRPGLPHRDRHDGLRRGGGHLHVPRSDHHQPPGRRIDIYRELADKFKAFVEVLAEIADATIMRGVGELEGPAPRVRALAQDRQRTARAGADVARPVPDARYERGRPVTRRSRHCSKATASGSCASAPWPAGRPGGARAALPARSRRRRRRLPAEAAVGEREALMVRKADDGAWRCPLRLPAARAREFDLRRMSTSTRSARSSKG